jgi:ComF family protein
MFEQLLKKEFVKNSIDFLFPPICLGCGEFTEEEFEICISCKRSIEPNNYAYCINCFNQIPLNKKRGSCCKDSFMLYAYSHYLPPLKDIIIHFKFKGITRSSKYLAFKTVNNFKTVFEKLQADYLVPIPLYPMRENIRGYNQAEIYADYLSELMNIEVNREIIIRNKKRFPQSRLKPKDRARNIKDVFQVVNNNPEKKNIILVDDVVTSGSTMTEAARVLTEAGYNVKGAIAIAHAD